MVLLYSGAVVFNNSQPIADQSLGGYPSSSSIPNARIANLFSTITKKTVTTNQYEVKMIVIKNTTGNTVSGITIYTTTPDNSLCQLQLAAVSPTIDSCNNPVFESIIDSQSLPYQATFSSCEGTENAITISSLANNAYIGLWVKKSIDQTQFPQIVGNPIGTPLTGDILISALEDQILIGEQDVLININWT